MAISARIDELRKKFDENPRRYFAPLANEYRKAGDPGQAIFICETYLPQQPGHMSGHIVFGQALYELNRLDEARGVFETALSLDPENLIALRHLGDIARKTGDNTAARGWYQRVLEADPRNDEIAQIVASLTFAPDTMAASETDAGVTAETSTTLVMESPVLRTPPRGNLGLVEHFDTSLGASPTPLEPMLSPPPLVAPAFLGSSSASDVAEKSPTELRMSGPIAQIRDEDLAAMSSTFARPRPSLPTPPFELQAVREAEEAEDLTFEPDSFAITAKPTEAPVEDDGHLDGAFVDESAFEPFSLGLPIPEIDEAPSGPDFVAQTSAADSVPDANSAAIDEPPPLPFVDMPTAAAITEPYDEPSADLVPEEDELASFLARHTQHFTVFATPEQPTVAQAETEELSVAAEAIAADDFGELATGEVEESAPSSETAAFDEVEPVSDAPAVAELAPDAPAVADPPAPTLDSGETVVVDETLVDMPESVAADLAPPGTQESESSDVASVFLEPVTALDAPISVAPVSGSDEVAQLEAAEPEGAQPQIADTEVAEPGAPEAHNSELEVTQNGDAVESNAVESNAVESNAVESNAVESNAVESNAVESNAVESNAVESNAVESGASVVAEGREEEAQVESHSQTSATGPVADHHDESVLRQHEAEIVAAAAAGIAALGAAALSRVTPASSDAVSPDVSSIGQHSTVKSEAAQTSEPPAPKAAVPQPVEPEPVELEQPVTERDAFVTETMADLYLQQGHLEPALDIYRRLVEQRPDDPQLRERLGAIERKLYGTPPTVGSSEAHEEKDAAPAGPTIRDFLSVFATRTRIAVAADVDSHEADSRQIETPAPAVDAPADHGSIDALFHGADAHVTDVNAATVLADAFAPDDGRTVPAIFEAPSSAAPAPHVESAAAAPHTETHAAGDGFSFDQFFAGDASRTAPATSRDAEPAPGDAADVAQFNQWLSGLKKPS